jgi:hypothetical protein
MNAVCGLVDGIGVGWAEGHRHFLVILGALVLVAHQPGDRRSDGDAIEQAAEDLHPVVLLAGGDDLSLAGLAAVEIGLNRVEVEGQPSTITPTPPPWAWWAGSNLQTGPNVGAAVANDPPCAKRSGRP